MTSAVQKQQEGRGVLGILGGRGGLSEPETLELLWWKEIRGRGLGTEGTEGGATAHSLQSLDALSALRWGPPCLVKERTDETGCGWRE